MAGLPSRVLLGDLMQPAVDPASRASLAVAVGTAGEGPLVIDLVQHGPHALVAGTTGSGKSEFLLAWLTALAGSYPPDRVAFLLVDFKGGAAFEPIRDLPHVTGVVTDLDESEAERAVLSLRAELRHRERVLAQAGARDIRSLDHRIELARLVIVVDEFQAMIERFPDLGAVIADIAARGRSLGLHLVLAAQRPNGVVREQVTANCAIRVSLRVMQRADSLAVVGSELAAEIAPDTPGRGIVDRGDGCPVRFQSGRRRRRGRQRGTDRERRSPSRPPTVDRPAAESRATRRPRCARAVRGRSWRFGADVRSRHRRGARRVRDRPRRRTRAPATQLSRPGLRRPTGTSSCSVPRAAAAPAPSLQPLRR